MSESSEKPLKPPGVSSHSGTAPPAEFRFPPGVSGNPAGRPKAGLALEEWVNIFFEQELPEAELRRIFLDKKLGAPKRGAALRILRLLEAGDLADFAGLLRGENNLEDLRGMGINTEVIKKFKQKTRKVPIGDGETEEVIEREIELHDRSGADFDRICDRTAGKPKQSLDVKHDGSLRTPDQGASAISNLLLEITNRIGHDAGGNAADDSDPRLLPDRSVGDSSESETA